MPRPLPCALALALSLSSAAQAEDQSFTYQLTASGRAIGSRDTNIQYLAGTTGEVRLLKAWTSFVLPVAGGTLSYEQRLGARLDGDRSFTSSISLSGQVREVQARVDPEGNWTVTVVELGTAKVWNLESAAVDLTSVELFDRERALNTLQQSAELRVLSAETGAIMKGGVEDLGLQTAVVGPDTVQVQRFRWSPPEGQMLLSYTTEGLLTGYEFLVNDAPVGAQLQALPPPRNYGTAIEGPLTGGAVREEQL